MLFIFLHLFCFCLIASNHISNGVFTELDIDCKTATAQSSCLENSSPKAFVDAVQNCSLLSRNLTSYYSLKEWNMVKNIMKKLNKRDVYAWTGLFVLNNKFQWTDGSSNVPLVFPLINSSLLNSSGCVAATVDSFINLECDHKLPYICGPKPGIGEQPKPPPSYPTDHLKCPDHHLWLHDKCIRFLDANVTWHEAVHKCNSTGDKGSALLTINSSMEQDYLTVFMAHYNKSAWIRLLVRDGGLFESKHATEFVSFTNWSPGQPTSSSNEECVSVLPDGKWKLSDCNKQMDYICEVDPISSNESHYDRISYRSLSFFGECHSHNYITLDGICIGLSEDVHNYQEDVPNCDNKFTPRTTAQWALIRLLMYNSSINFAWMGVRINKEVLKEKSLSIEFDRITGPVPKFMLPIDFANLPNSTENYCFAFDLDSNIFPHMPCSTKLRTICAHTIGPAPEPKKRHKCPDDWILRGSKCYFKPPHQSAVNWFDAERNCQLEADGGHLIAIHDANDVWILTSQTGKSKSTYDWWIGLRASYPVGSSRSLHYHWSDSSNINFLRAPVASGNLASIPHNLIEACFTFYPKSHTWEPKSCEDKKAYMCQVDVEPSSEKQTVSPPVQSPNPVQFANKSCSTIEGKKFCVQYSSTQLSFHEADYRCQRENQTLAVILSKQQQSFVTNYLKNLTKSAVYFGLFSLDGHLHWLSRYPTIPVVLLPNEQDFDTSLGLQCCIIHNGSWDYSPCSTGRPFICTSTDHLVHNGLHYSGQAYDCPKGYWKLKTGCFMPKVNIEDELTWDAAETACATSAKNGHLAVIDSQTTNDGLALILNAVASDAWIGLRASDGAYRWSDNSKLLYMSSELAVTGHASDHCILLIGQQNKIGEWKQFDCSKKAKYICQAHPIATSGKPSTESRFLQRGRCAETFYQYGSRCYTLIHKPHYRSKEPMADDVTKVCHNLMGDKQAEVCAASPDMLLGTHRCPVPAVFEYLEDAAFIRYLISVYGGNYTEAWIGAKMQTQGVAASSHKRFYTEGRFSSMFANLFDFYMDFDSNVTSNDYVCLAISKETDRIQSKKCLFTNLPVVCTYNLNSVPIKSAKFDACPANWTLVNGRCYATNEKMHRSNWLRSKESCTHRGQLTAKVTHKPYVGYLASIHSKEEEAGVLKISTIHSSWIGLHIYPDLRGPYSSRKSQLDLKWEDGSPVDFIQNFSSINKTLVEFDMELCTTISEGSTRWEAVECSQSRGYICQLSLHGADTSCSDHDLTLRLNNELNCYKLFPNHETWQSANAYCQSLNPPAQLASIHSWHELMKLQEFLKLRISSYQLAWIGLKLSFGSFKWSDYSEIDFIAIKSEMKFDFGADCFLLGKNLSSPESRLWQPDRCNKKHMFVCHHKLPSRQQQTPTSDVPKRPASTGKSILCPTGFWPYRGNCFALSNQGLRWADADAHCKKLVTDAHFEGSLARIHDDAVQAFVSGLLGNVSDHYPAAWIGLKQKKSNGTYLMNSWSGGQPVNYLRPSFFHKRLSNHTLNKKHSPDHEECIAMMKSTSPQLNGVWLRIACDNSFLPSICQASPLDASEQTIVPNNNTGCPESFTPTPSAVSHLDSPMCYRLLSNKFSWKDSKGECERLALSHGRKIEQLTLTSPFQAEFVKSWLINQSLYTKSSSKPDTVWTALRVMNDSSQTTANYWHFNWSVSPPELVRYTDWLTAPNNLTGCYLFNINSYASDPELHSNGLRSLRPAEHCNDKYFTVCQTRQNTAERKFATGHEQLVRQPCSKLKHKLAKGLVSIWNLGTISNSGRPCMRWDLAPGNLSLHYESQFLGVHDRLSASAIVGGEDTFSYAENYCSEWFNELKGNFEYGCYTSWNPPRFEACPIVTCTGRVLTLRSKGYGLVVFVAVFSVLVVGLVAVFFWKRRRASHFRFTRLPQSNNNNYSVVILMDSSTTSQTSALMSESNNDEALQFKIYSTSDQTPIISSNKR